MKSYPLSVRQDDQSETDQSLRTIIFVAEDLHSTVNVITINNKLTFSLLKWMTKGNFQKSELTGQTCHFENEIGVLKSSH